MNFIVCELDFNNADFWKQISEKKKNYLQPRDLIDNRNVLLVEFNCQWNCLNYENVIFCWLMSYMQPETWCDHKTIFKIQIIQNSQGKTKYHWGQQHEFSYTPPVFKSKLFCVILTLNILITYWPSSSMCGYLINIGSMSIKWITQELHRSIIHNISKWETHQMLKKKHGKINFSIYFSKL